MSNRSVLLKKNQEVVEFTLTGVWVFPGYFF
jgi:hypothetical protein